MLCWGGKGGLGGDPSGGRMVDLGAVVASTRAAFSSLKVSVVVCTTTKIKVYDASFHDVLKTMSLFKYN